jgi:hypothetical protein
MQERGVQKQGANKFDRNRETYEKNDARILRIIESEPGLRIGQMARKAKLGRRIVREHLWNLQEQEKVTQVGAGYFLAGVSSAELNELVKKMVREGSIVQWNIRFDRNVAGCYTFVDPEKKLHVFDDLFFERAKEFLEGGFWLDEILVYAIRNGLVSRRVHSHGKKTIDKRLLRKGWESCFGDTRVLIFAYAISPPRFLHYLLSPRGIAWATRFLENRWDSIMREVAERPVPRTKRLALHMLDMHP